MKDEDIARFARVLMPMIKSTRCPYCKQPMQPTEAQLTVVYLTVIEGRTHVEAAKEAGISFDAAAVLFHRLAKRCGMTSRQFRHELSHAYWQAVGRGDV